MRFSPGLYPVITQEFCGRNHSLEVLEAVIAGGASIVQLREKHLCSKELFNLAIEYRKITAASNVLLIVNDRLDVALAVGADGVHLGQDDLPCSEARKIAPNLIIGISTHCKQEVREAEKNGAT